jgi:ribosome-associated translation inhibitor RaiA
MILMPTDSRTDSEAFMNFPIQITYRGLDASPYLESYVRRRAEKLSLHGRSLVGCHVVLAAPHRHKQHGRPFEVHVLMSAGGGEIAVSHRAGGTPASDQDLYACVDAVFDRAVRRLHEHFARRRASRDRQSA